MDNRSGVCVFSYGSNLCSARMRSRVPSAIVVASGFVRHRKIAFHKKSIDGSAKADAVLTSSATDRLWGVVYQLHRQDKLVLDQYEFLGIGYDEVQVNVVLNDRSMMAWMYIARPSAIDSSLLPYGWYLDYVIAGARELRLPDSYICDLMKIESQVDPDAPRRAENRRLIGT